MVVEVVVEEVVLLVVDDVVLLLVVLEVVLLVVDVVVQGVVQLSLFVQIVLQSYTDTSGLAMGGSLKQKLYVVKAGTITLLYPDAPHSLMVIDEVLPVLFTIV